MALKKWRNVLRAHADLLLSIRTGGPLLALSRQELQRQSPKSAIRPVSKPVAYLDRRFGLRRNQPVTVWLVASGRNIFLNVPF